MSISAKRPGRDRFGARRRTGSRAYRSEHLVSAIEELVANARAADPNNLDVVVSRKGRHSVIEIQDPGTGLQIDAARTFEPYVTTRANGTGLGLAIVRALTLRTVQSTSANMALGSP